MHLALFLIDHSMVRRNNSKSKACSKANYQNYWLKAVDWDHFHGGKARMLKAKAETFISLGAWVFPSC